MKYPRSIRLNRCTSDDVCQQTQRQHANKLAEQLRVSFDCKQILGPLKIWPLKIPFEPKYSYTEEYSAANFLGDKSWTDLTGPMLETSTLSVWSNVPWVISQQAFFYFLPGFLMVMLCDSILGPTLSMAVVSRLQVMIARRDREPLDQLTVAQQDAVVATLIFCDDLWKQEGYEFPDLRALINAITGKNIH